MSLHDSGRPAISQLARAILEEFAESFPESAHYRGGRRLRKAGWEAVFPQIVHDVEAKEEFLESVEELSALGVIEVRWRRFRPGTEVEALYLKDPDTLFALLGRTTPDETREQMLAVLGAPPWSPDPRPTPVDELLESVRDHLRALLEARHPTPVPSPQDLADLGTLLRVSREQVERFPIRALSVHLFRDSKRLEQLLRTADAVVQKVSGESFSESRGLKRSFPEVSLALLGAIRLDRTTIDSHGEIFTLPAETVGLIESVDVSGSAALSVENKESFFVLARQLREGNLPSRFGAVTYCGGYPHEAYAHLLRELARAGARLLHFGDLDADGLLILHETERLVGETVVPFGMTGALYSRFLPYGYALSDARLDRLRAAWSELSPPSRDLADSILEHRKGVEQEVIGLEDLF